MFMYTPQEKESIKADFERAAGTSQHEDEGRQEVKQGLSKLLIAVLVIAAAAMLIAGVQIAIQALL